MATANHNHLIDLLPAADRTRLVALCRPVHLELAEVLTEPGEPTHHVWFPQDGFVSLVAQIQDHPGLEVGMVGREGMVGATLALGVGTSPMRTVVQGGGSAWRIAAAPFKAELMRSPALRRLLGRYLYVRMAQMANTVACLRFHLIAPRLARWLLMSEDRAGHDRFHLTHEFLAYMLGVRRVSITVAAGGLQRRGLIHYHRGDLTVLDRAGLEAASCGCYDVDQKSYAELLG